jgi:hypothetical protein
MFESVAYMLQWMVSVKVTTGIITLFGSKVWSTADILTFNCHFALCSLILHRAFVSSSIEHSGSTDDQPVKSSFLDYFAVVHAAYLFTVMEPFGGDGI